MDLQEKSYSPQEIESLISLIDTCILEANQTINSLHKEILTMLQIKIKSSQRSRMKIYKLRINQINTKITKNITILDELFFIFQKEMQLMLLEKDEEIKKLQGLLEMKNQQNQLKVNNGNINSNRNDDLSHFLKIIDSLNTENKQLRQQIELLQYENQKAIQLACSAKNNKLFREINSKLDLQSPNNSNIENNVAAMNINDTFTNKLKGNLQNINSNNSNSNNNLNINNLSYIHHNNNSFNNSTNEILKKFNLSDSTNLANPSATIMNNQQLTNNNSTNLASTKKNYKYLKPKK